MRINQKNIFLYKGIENLAKSLDASQLKIKGIKTENKNRQDFEFNKRCHKVLNQINDLMKLSEIIQNVDKKLTLKACENEALEVSRYSLSTGQVWHTWQIPPHNEAIAEQQTAGPF